VAIDPSFFALQLSPYARNPGQRRSKVVDTSGLPALFRTLDRLPVIDTHKVGIMYVALGQTHEREILGNNHGSPAYTRFLEGIGRLINLRGQVDVYAGGLDPDEDGEYAYAWWDDIGQILYHTATMMPNHAHDPHFDYKKRHIGNDLVRIIWNDSGMPYRFDTLLTQFQFVNIVIEPHSPLGAIATFSSKSLPTTPTTGAAPRAPAAAAAGSQPQHENEYFRVTVQRAPGMTEFTPIGNFKLISAENLPLLVRQLSLLADWFASVFQHTQGDTVQVEVQTNWRARLQSIKRFRTQMPPPPEPAEQPEDGGEDSSRDFTVEY
jgi:tuberous sclerosis protein 2